MSWYFHLVAPRVCHTKNVWNFSQNVCMLCMDASHIPPSSPLNMTYFMNDPLFISIFSFVSILLCIMCYVVKLCITNYSIAVSTCMHKNVHSACFKCLKYLRLFEVRHMHQFASIYLTPKCPSDSDFLILTVMKI